MYSTRCPYCHQLVNLKTDEVRQAVDETEAKKQQHYELHCPHCRRLIKVQVKELKRKLPMAITLPTEATAEENGGKEETKEKPARASKTAKTAKAGKATKAAKAPKAEGKKTTKTKAPVSQKKARSTDEV